MNATERLAAQREAFLTDILANPTDDTLRLIFADWLEDHGEPDRAEFIRVQFEQRSVVDPERLAVLKERELHLLHHHAEDWTRKDFPELTKSSTISWYFLTTGFGIQGNPNNENRWVFCIDRGFIDRVYCSYSVWINYGRQIVRRHPVSKVILDDRFPYCAMPRETYHWHRTQNHDFRSSYVGPFLDYLKTRIRGAIEREEEPYHYHTGYKTPYLARVDLNEAALLWAKSDNVVQGE